MKKIIQLEELAQFIGGILLFSQLHLSWWWFIALIFTPDISMIGYLVNNKYGAWLYNIFHHKGLAILIYVLGIYLQQPLFTTAGIILFTHSSMDRILGYGLKYESGFNDTHLGKIRTKRLD